MYIYVIMDSTYVGVSMCVLMYYVHVSVYVFMFICVYIYLCMLVAMYVCMYAYLSVSLYI
jgi:hypothetical protein